MCLIFDGGKTVNNWKILYLTGIVTCLVGAFLMAFGESIIGADHTGVATVVGIIGIGLIANGTTTSIVNKKKEGTEK
jgi:hypothetical protein